MPEDLKKYKFDSLKLSVYLIQWKEQKAPPILDRIAPWVDFFNYNLSRYGYRFLTDEKLQKQKLNGKNLVQYLHSIYNDQPVDKFVMYGRDGYTNDHAFSDRSAPDFIYVRPQWYLTYVQNLYSLLNYKFNNLTGDLNITLFTKMVEFATANKCSLKGIIDYEIAKEREVNHFYIPVFYSKFNRLAASYDAVYNTNYLQVAKDARKFTEAYLTQKNIKFTVQEINGNEKYNSAEGYFTLSGYKFIIQ